MLKYNCLIQRLVQEREMKNADILTWITANAILEYEHKKIPLSVTALLCIKEPNLYLYTLNDITGKEIALLFECNIHMMNNIVCVKGIMKNKISFWANNSQICCYFSSRKKWKKTKRIIERIKKCAYINVQK